jgi:hypothetical protein
MREEVRIIRVTVLRIRISSALWKQVKADGNSSQPSFFFFHHRTPFYYDDQNIFGLLSVLRPTDVGI